MAAVKCNDCLRVFVMAEDVTPLACPYCAKPNRFSIRGPCGDLHAGERLFEFEKRIPPNGNEEAEAE